MKPRIEKAGQRLITFADEMRPFVRRLIACDEDYVAGRVSVLAEELRTIGEDLHARRGQPHDEWREKARAKS